MFNPRKYRRGLYTAASFMLGSNSTPVSILGTSLVAWYDGTDASTITLTSGKVSAWADKSGNGNTATQGTAGNRPTYDGTINGKAGLTFTAASATRLDIALAVSQPIEVFMVVQVTSMDSTQRWLFGAGASASRTAYYNNTVNDIVYTYAASAPGSATDAIHDLTVPTIIDTLYSGADSFLHANAAVGAADLGADGFSNPITIGDNTVGTAPMDGVFGEAILASGPTPTQRTQVISLLKSKWAISF